MYKTMFSVFMLQLIIVFQVIARDEKMSLSHDDYENWKTLTRQQLSADGKWASWEVNPQQGDGMLYLRDLETGRKDSVARGSRPSFSPGSRYLAFSIKPPSDLVRQAKMDKESPREMPKDSLGIIILPGLERIVEERVKSFAVPEEESGWMVYHKEKELPDTTKKADNESDTLATANKPSNNNSKGTTLVIFNPVTGDKHEFPGVTHYSLSKNGKLAAFIQEDSSAVMVFNTLTQLAARILETPGTAKSLSISEAGDQVAFIFSPGSKSVEDDENGPQEKNENNPATDQDEDAGDEPDDDKPEIFDLWYWSEGAEEATMIVDTTTAGMPHGWSVSEHTSPGFTEKGDRLFFGTAEKPEPEPEDTLLREEKYRVDIWHYQDPRIQPQQLAELNRDRRKTYTAVYHIDRREMVQLADEQMPNLTTVQRGKGELEIGTSVKPYRIQSSFEAGSYSDVYLVNVNTGERRLVLEKYRGSALRSVHGSDGLSPEGNYLLYYSQADSNWHAMTTAGNRTRNLTADIPRPVYNELHDQPSDPRPYGIAGWVEGDRYVLVYDRYDIWITDPEGNEPPVSLTGHYGRDSGIRLRYINLDPEKESIGRREEILLSAFNENNKQSGFYTVRVHRPSEPSLITMEDARYYTPQKAKEADVLIWRKGTFREYPELWTGDARFRDPERISSTNPQQDKYKWGNAQLVDWISFKNDTLQGILYTPENMEPGKKYPMLVYFYERLSYNLHRHYVPSPSRSTINMTWCVSNDYVVFVPDIPYTIGYPGQSAYDAVVSGTKSMVSRFDFIDRANIGIQGQSWGGYQIAWLITRTDMFRAAMAGAPVSNMISAYGGIRWASGLSRIFQYEETQSRIGGTIWDETLRYIENSPVFYARRVNTPLLMMHNDDDGAVPWYQGIEYFMSLRRLGKPVWMLNYNDEAHNLTRWPNRMDLSVRMYQFFDHYLKGKPAPVWMIEGIPAIKKEKTDGYEPAE